MMLCPVAMSMTRRVPRTTFFAWVKTTSPPSVTLLAFTSKSAQSPLASWPFLDVTSTLPRASMRVSCAGSDLAFGSAATVMPA